MQKTLTFVLLSLTLLLAACGGSATAENTAAEDSAAEPPPAQEQPAPVGSGASTAANCSVVSGEAPQQTLPFAEVTASDWTHGPGTAYVTFVEYGDFQ